MFKSLVANALVLGGVVWLSRLLGVGAEYGVAVFWFQLVMQVLFNELWLYAGAVPALLAVLFSRKHREEHSARLALRLVSVVLVVVPLFLYTVLYLLRPLMGEWVLAELGVPLCGMLLLASLAGQFVLFALVWLLGLVPVCPSALFNMLDDAIDKR
ncbi:MAG: hypothetical protein Q4F38_06345 [Akkermansia sp.]|nr:hypothetical protein [Akkermansia sp.]